MMTEQSSGRQNAFPLTRWSLVRRAAREDRQISTQALNGLLAIYQPVLKAHLVHGMKLPSDRADDLLQGFVARKVLADNLLGRADDAKGKFRSFLLKALTNYVIGEVRRSQAKKRGGDELPAASLSESPDLVAVDAGIEHSFDVAWARQVLSQAILRMQEECSRKKRDELWRIFECRVLEPTLEQAETMSYETLVARFGLASPSQAANLLITAKRMFQRVLAEVVRDTVAEDADVEAEIRELKGILAGGKS